MIAVLLQSRVNSTRLPGKALLKLGDRTVTEMAMDALRQVAAKWYILATNFQSREKLAPLAAHAGFSLSWGSDQDVLQRFCDVIRYYRCDHIIRATGDNPLVSPRRATAALERYLHLGCDYFAYRNLPLGTGIEVVSAWALLRAEGADTTPYDREHVTPYIYNNPQRFNVVHEDVILPTTSTMRFTLDTAVDWTHIQQVYAALGSQHPIEIEELIRYQAHTNTDCTSQHSKRVP